MFAKAKKKKKNGLNGHSLKMKGFCPVKIDTCIEDLEKISEAMAAMIEGLSKSATEDVAAKASEIRAEIRAAQAVIGKQQAKAK